jgi:hypothetical protein
MIETEIMNTIMITTNTTIIRIRSFMSLYLPIPFSHYHILCIVNSFIGKVENKVFHLLLNLIDAQIQT